MDLNTDYLVIEGIMSRGFGMMPKWIMTNKFLPFASKTILAYFVSYAGAGMTAFPSRGRVLSDLGISGNTYDKYMKPLKESGIITVRQINAGGKGNGFGHNLYTLNMNAVYRPGPEEAPEPSEEVPMDGPFSVFFSGVYRDGYGVIPKTVMTDRELSVTSKSLYAYICAFSGGTDRACPKVDDMLDHLGIGRSAYQTHMKALVERGYITIVQSRGGKGRMSRNTFILNQGIPMQEDSPHIGFCGTQNPPHGEICDTQSPPHIEFCGTQNPPYGGKPQTQNCGTKINSSENNNSIQVSINQSDSTYKEDPSEMMDGSTEPPAEDREEISLEEYYARNSEKIKEELLEQGEIPAEWCGDERKLETAVRVMTDWDERTQTDEEDLSPVMRAQLRTYRLFVPAMTDLLKNTPGGHFLLGETVSSVRIRDRLMAWYVCRAGTDGRVRLTISDLFCEIYSAYMRAADGVRNPFRYMQSCIWSALRSGRQPEADWMDMPRVPAGKASGTMLHDHEAGIVKNLYI